MNISPFLRRLKTFVRQHRLLAVGVPLLLVVALAAAANSRPGDTLLAPVNIHTPTDAVVLRVTEEGELIFIRRNRQVARLDGRLVLDLQRSLLDQGSVLDRQQLTLDEHERRFAELQRELQRLERHLEQDRTYRRLGGR